MALIAALLRTEEQRRVLGEATRGHDVAWAEDWRDLARLVKARPAVAAVADLHAERGKDGVLRIYRFSQRFPLTPIVVWGELDGRDLFRLGKAGATDVVPGGDAGNPGLVEEMMTDALGDQLADRLEERLRTRVRREGRALVRTATAGLAAGLQVPGLAAGHGVSVSTLERRCEQWGLSTPGRLLLWLRILYGLQWLLEPGRSVESVAGQLGYSSGAAFRRAIKATVGGRPTPLRNTTAFEGALAAFVAECPGDGTVLTQEH
ncbi:MAG TPA: helix-turn-helix domain-containing protein [Longimicrobiales bacterium]|nr:helix-turn-helix domain-containing protein [Longimicrobiales bacterium]